VGEWQEGVELLIALFTVLVDDTTTLSLLLLLLSPLFLLLLLTFSYSPFHSTSGSHVTS